ncbi:MAG TPA: LysM domain-containing protein, partial [Candidatus Hydrogenedentes bacterium]|nr:LysM domain-containing protein [Candidatus Hydrogenedentota bacterium]
VYVVQPGDTLSRIAGRYGISQAELMRINDIQDRNLVKIGSKLKVPRTPGSGGEQGTPAE